MVFPSLFFLFPVLVIFAVLFVIRGEELLHREADAAEERAGVILRCAARAFLVGQAVVIGGDEQLGIPLQTDDAELPQGGIPAAGGIGEYKGHTAYVEFQNENLTATVDGKILATTPDLISLVDTETYIPVTTDGLKYGKRVMVVGLKCFHLWRTEKGIELVGPRYFGVDTDYIPLEERCEGGN